jgi:4,5-dihydroxyphthalate decarboxylase
MLVAGGLDAVYSPPRPKRYDPVNGPIVRLFPDIRAVERDYFRQTGCFPPQHLVILRRDIWEQNKWMARSLTDAFIRCNTQFTTAQRQFPYVFLWLEAEIEETEAVMGADFHPYGFEKNRDTIDIFCRQAHELGIVGRLITAEEYFDEFLAS